MKVNIKQKIDEPLLSRQRIEGEVAFSGAVPSKEELKKDIASQVKAQPELVNVEHVYTKFGTGNANVLAHVYSDKKSFQLLKKKKGKKGSEKKEDKKEPAPKQEKKDEAPKEETKKEEKTEDKKE